MSGGSLHYLARRVKWGGDWMEGHQDLDRVEEFLVEHGPSAAEALRQTKEVRALLQQAQDLALKLANVWEAIEWRLSGDSDDVDAELKNLSDRTST